MSDYRRSAVVVASLSPVIAAAVINIATSLVKIPESAERWALIGAVLIISAVVFLDARRISGERRRERGQEGRERTEQGGQSRTVVYPVRVAQLGRRRIPGYLIKEPPQVVAVNSAWGEVVQAARSAGEQFEVSLPWWRDDPVRLIAEIARRTSDDQWLIIGDNVSRLRKAMDPVATVISQAAVGRLAALVPTDESAEAFVASAAIVRGQIGWVCQSV